MKILPGIPSLYQRIPWVQFKPQFGIAIGVNLKYSLGSNSAAMDQIQALGVSWARMVLAWDWIERSKGSYDWTDFLATVDAFNSRGISVLLVTNNDVNAPYLDPNQPPGNIHNAPVTQSEIDAYANFHGLAAQQLGTRSVAYQICNEVNWYFLDYEPGAAARDYTNLVEATAAQIRSNYSGKGACSIISAGIVMDWALGKTDLLKQCVALGLFDHLSGCAVHTYGYGQPGNAFPPLSQLASDYDKFRAIFSNYPNFPIWVTECGYSTTGAINWDAFTPADQATAIVNICKANRTYAIPNTFVFEFSDDPTRANEPPPNNHESGFGLVDQNFVPKPSYAAVQKFLRPWKLPWPPPWPKKRPSAGLKVNGT